MIDPTAGLLLLADSRFPGGGHAHSGGVEAVVDRGLLRDAGELGVFLDGRVAGAGTVVAAVAAAGCLLAERAEPVDWARWDAAVSARTPSAALREASRVQGSALLRTARRVWQAAALEALARHGRPHHPLVLGAAVAAGGGAGAVAAAGGGAGAAAALAVHHLLGGACSAAVRLLGLDPIEVAAVQAQAARRAEPLTCTATRAAREAVEHDDPRRLPSTGTPLPEVLAQLHARSEVTLFAS